ncbi:hypothetical protein CC78DRAFT_16957 [Lojkania enalia]|uniref:Zn(2)-C6 fungal-type domain-containing protein n=1 Tax=Lojkania enalia TaxID=147567 RepID=A0A9P4KHE7_9PLEO|nr:hypothetical protein CC78DRAFT_16957 [Didymosphaeria enalia]
MSFTITSPADWRDPLIFVNKPFHSSTSSQSLKTNISALSQRKPKLRTSCDACSTSKVKCSKQHPTCARCTLSGIQCVYGISRRHGKPPRKQRSNPDKIPTATSDNQSFSPDKSGFGKLKLKLKAKPLLPDLTETETVEWKDTPAWPSTPDIEYQMTSDPVFSEPDFIFMNNIHVSGAELQEDFMHAVEPSINFRDPFAKKEILYPDPLLPSDFQALRDFVGGDFVHPMEYTLDRVNTDVLIKEEEEVPQSPKSVIPWAQFFASFDRLDSSLIDNALGHSSAFGV